MPLRLPPLDRLANLVEREYSVRDFLSTHPVLQTAKCPSEFNPMRLSDEAQTKPIWIIEDYIVSGQSDLSNIFVSLKAYYDALSVGLGSVCQEESLIKSLRLVENKSDVWKDMWDWVFLTDKQIELGHTYPFGRHPHSKKGNFIYYAYRQSFMRVLGDESYPVKIDRRAMNRICGYEIVGDTSRLVLNAEKCISDLLGQKFRVVEPK